MFGSSSPVSPREFRPVYFAAAGSVSLITFDVRHLPDEATDKLAVGLGWEGVACAFVFLEVVYLWTTLLMNMEPLQLSVLEDSPCGKWTLLRR